MLNPAISAPGLPSSSSLTRSSKSSIFATLNETRLLGKGESVRHRDSDFDPRGNAVHIALDNVLGSGERQAYACEEDYACVVCARRGTLREVLGRRFWLPENRRSPGGRQASVCHAPEGQRRTDVSELRQRRQGCQHDF